MSLLVLKVVIGKFIHEGVSTKFIGKKEKIRTARNTIERLYCIRADNCFSNNFFNPNRITKKIQIMTLLSRK